MQIIIIASQTHISSYCSATHKLYIREAQIGDSKHNNCFFFVRFFFGRHRASFIEVSEFDQENMQPIGIADYPSEISVCMLDLHLGNYDTVL